jgi:hypothetical protein
MSAMTPRQAFWEVLATVGIPSLVIWGALLYLLRAQTTPDEWPLLLILVAMPLPLFFPIYNRYRKGDKRGGKDRPPRYHLTWAILIAALSTAYALDAFHRSGWDRVFHLVLAMGWLVVSGDHFRRWGKARATLPPDGVTG